MTGMRWHLFRLQGIPIRVDASWLLILALLTWTSAVNFSEIAPGLTVTSYWTMGLTTALAFFTCIVLHELGHALVAQKLGISLHGITLFLFGGVAEMEDEPPSARGEFLMAIAGPAVSAALAVIFWLLASVAAQLEWAVQIVAIFQFLTWINLSVLMFNMVPAFPLDGGRVFRSALWGAFGDLRRATYWASLAGRTFAWVLIALGMLQAVNGAILGGMWLILIGMFLNTAARVSYQQVLAKHLLRGEPIYRIMSAHPIVVPPSITLRQWVEDYVYRFRHKMFPVGTPEHIEGVISTKALAKYPRDQWESHFVGEVMRPDFDAIALPANADALEALEQMQRTGSPRLLVIEGGLLIGIVSLKDLLRFLELKRELENAATADKGSFVFWKRSAQTQKAPRP